MYQHVVTLTIFTRGIFSAAGKSRPCGERRRGYFAGGVALSFFAPKPIMVFTDSSSFCAFPPKFVKPCSNSTTKQNVEAMKSANQKSERRRAIKLRRRVSQVLC